MQHEQPHSLNDGRWPNQAKVTPGSATVWLTQLEIAELFQTTKQNVSLQAKNILKDQELFALSVVKECLTTARNLPDTSPFSTQSPHFLPTSPSISLTLGRIGQAFLSCGPIPD